MFGTKNAKGGYNIVGEGYNMKLNLIFILSVAIIGVKGGWTMIRRADDKGRNIPMREDNSRVGSQDAPRCKNIGSLANALLERSLKKHAAIWRELAKH